MATPLAVLSLFWVLKNPFWVSVFFPYENEYCPFKFQACVSLLISTQTMAATQSQHRHALRLKPRPSCHHSHRLLHRVLISARLPFPCQNPGVGTVFNGNRNHRHQHSPRLQPRARKSQCLQVAEISTPSVWPWRHRDSLVPTWSPVSIGTLEQKGCPRPS